MAKELAQNALVVALERWPAEGVPRNPGAWLMTTAKRRTIDQIRRNETFKRKVEEVDFVSSGRPLSWECETCERSSAPGGASTAREIVADQGKRHSLIIEESAVLA